jgi:hypothetical protein
MVQRAALTYSHFSNSTVFPEIKHFRQHWGCRVYKSLWLRGVLGFDNFFLLLLPMSGQSLLATSFGHASNWLPSLILTGLVSNGSSGHSSWSPALSAPYTGLLIDLAASTVSSDELKEYLVSGDSDSLESLSASVGLWWHVSQVSRIS